MINPNKSVYIRGLRRLSRRIINPIRLAGKPKIFCIGRNKTGTTSIEKAPWLK